MLLKILEGNKFCGIIYQDSSQEGNDITSFFVILIWFEAKRKERTQDFTCSPLEVLIILFLIMS